jgi:hypothetical protein
MTKDGIAYIRAIYKSCMDKKENENYDKYPEFTQGFFYGHFATTRDIIEAVALFERFSLEE